MRKVTVREAKAYFSRILRHVAAGEEITIVSRGVPVARLVPIPAEETRRKLGFFRGEMSIPDDFDAPLPDNILDAFEGKRRRKKHKRKNRDVH